MSELSEAEAAVPQENSSNRPRRKRRLKIWLFGSLAVVIVLAGLYVGAAYLCRDRIAANVSVAGVNLGGMTREQAENELRQGLSQKLTAPRQVAFTGNAKTETIDPASFSLAVDYDATLNKLVGFSFDPRRLWAHVTGSQNVDAVVTTDRGQLDAQLVRVAGTFNVAPVNAQLTLSGGNATVTPATDGVEVDVPASREAIAQQWLTSDGPITLPQRAAQAAITTADMDEFVRSQVTPLFSAPVTVNVESKQVSVSPEQIAQMVSYSPQADTPKLAVDQQKLGEILNQAASEVLTPPIDAKITIQNGAPVITPSQPGKVIDIAKVGNDLLAVSANAQRTINAAVTEQDAAFSTKMAESMGIKEVVSEISTPLTSDSVRTINLVRGTAVINNTLVKPGERFNLGQALGPVDTEHGFVSSGVVVNGFNSEAMGGGLSQLSTNTFNIGYRAGMVDVAHTPHSKYFSRYPAGLESTLWGDQIQMIWENNTPYGALIEAWVSDGQVHTRLWSTKYWDVKVWQGEKRNFVKPTTRVNPAADCEPSGAGGDGFTITVGRTVSLNGAVHEDSQYTWRYEPVDAVRCG
ncbi:VanW family protein [Trueperella sp. LYQ143]|uniref:VanW family protein n=1 Tax=unclassified Trueperella TaxID=2630174 RepID=UPI003983C9E4